jgi:hypothetical protein
MKEFSFLTLLIIFFILADFNDVFTFVLPSPARTSISSSLPKPIIDTEIPLFIHSERAVPS